MAYQEVACNSMAEVPVLIGNFAATLGWVVLPLSDHSQNGTPRRSIRRPIEADEATKPDGDIRNPTTYHLYSRVFNGGPTGNAASSAGETNVHWVAIAKSDAPNAQAWAISPWTIPGDQRQPVIPLPTKLHLFGAGLPRPFIHCVIEYAFNQYRHLYIGSLDRLGTQDICDVISSSQGFHRRADVGYPVNFMAWPGLFSGCYSNKSMGFSRLNGGVHLPDGYYPFDMFNQSEATAGMTSTASIKKVAFGGARDGLDDFLISHGFSTFSGGNFFVPINLVIDGGVPGQRALKQLGAVRGVRNVNMRNLEPGASIVVGNERWRVFPQLSKKEDPWTRAGLRQPSQPTGTANTYHTGDTSHHWGVALLEGSA